jgi:hypothetical protein
VLPQADILQTIAEIAIAIAGFAALAGAFGTARSEAQNSTAAFHSLRLVVINGLFLLVSALIPLVLFDYGLAASTTWRLSSGLVLANNLIGLVRTLVKDEGALAQTNEWNLRHIMWAIEVVCLAALVANVFAVFKEFASALYLTFLVAQVARVAMMFLRFFEIAFTREST